MTQSLVPVSHYRNDNISYYASMIRFSEFFRGIKLFDEAPDSPYSKKARMELLSPDWDSINNRPGAREVKSEEVKNMLALIKSGAVSPMITPDYFYI